jgi:hypothetical protein
VLASSSLLMIIVVQLLLLLLVVTILQARYCLKRDYGHHDSNNIYDLDDILSYYVNEEEVRSKH